MKRLRFALLVLLAFCFFKPAMAQEEPAADAPAVDSAAVPEKFQYKLGIFGNFHSGIGFAGYGDLAKDLQAPSALGPNLSMSPLATNYGGSLHLLLFKRLMLSFAGNAFSAHVSETDTGQVNVLSTFLGGNIGFVAINKRLNINFGDEEIDYQLLLFPYVGFQTGKMKTEVANFSERVINFGDQDIDRSVRSTFEASMSIIEIGVGTRVDPGKPGGVMLGLDLGGFIGIGGGKWQNADKVDVANVQDASLMGGYLRFTVGGGLFKANQDYVGKPKPPKEPKAPKEPKVKKKKKGEEEVAPVEESAPASN